jgi:hypothetical protein
MRRFVATIGGTRGQRGWTASVASALLAFQLLFVLHTADANLKIVWRLLVLSFDNPATQALDELASAKSPYDDSTRHVLTIARIAAAASRRTELPGSELFPPRVDLCSCITRSPPLV